MRILSNNDYNDLLEQIKQGEQAQKDYVNDKQGYIEQINRLNLEKKEFEKTLRDKEDCINFLTANRVQIIQDSSTDTKSKKDDELSSKYKKMCARAGGLTKENNKLRLEIKEAKEKIENYKCELKNKHRKLSINEYDKRLKPSLNRR